MFRSPRRNGRNKGLKIKHVLQISALLGVSVWLLYQVHHSDEKKPSISENMVQKLHNVRTRDMQKMGRKYLQPKLKQPTKLEPEEHQTDEANNNDTEPEDLVQDHETEDHEDIKHEEDGENENTDGPEETTETEHHESKNEKINKSEKGEEIKEKIVVGLNPKVENGKDNTSSSKGPSVDLLSKKETLQHMNNSGNKNTTQDSNFMPSVDPKIENLVKRNSKDSMISNGKDDEQSNKNENNGKKNEEGGVVILGEEKEALTDVGTLPESGIGGRSSENTAAE